MEDIVRGGVNAKHASERLAIRNTPATFSGTGYDTLRKTAYVGTPYGEDARSRTTRIKEQLVANAIGPFKFSQDYPDLIKRTAIDSMALRHRWPDEMPRQASRDAVATAIRQLRSIAKASNEGNLNRIETWQRAMTEAVHASSIAFGPATAKAKDYVYGKSDPTAFTKLIRRANRLVSEIAGSQAGQIRQIATDDSIAAKAVRLQKFLGNVAGQANESGQPQPPDPDAEFGDEGDTVMVLGGVGGMGGGVPMEIINPRRYVPTDATVKHRAYARSGAVIRSCRLAPLISTGSMSTLFVKTRRRLGGAILIDASGSMGLTAEFLESVCKRLPAATIAYYSGDGGSKCHLVIHAKDGRRADHIEPTLGGNECDYFALQWLLRQQGPRAFVTDGQFCGGYPWQAQACHALLKTAVARRQVTWHLNLHDLEDAGKCFGGRTT